MQILANEIFYCIFAQLINDNIMRGPRVPSFFRKMLKEKIDLLLTDCFDQRPDLFLIDFSITENNEISVNMFFDSENYVLKVKYLTSEFINTTFGKIYCYKIQPYVQSGRVFKKDESLTMWITADKNRVPIKMKADLLVGSVKIDLESFSSLTYPFEVQFD